MADIAIKFENISKQYRLGRVSTRTLGHDLNRWWQTSIMGKEDPYLEIGSTNDRTQKADSEYVWSLKNINFEIEQGDVVGIIGKNGAGKSTLLKILSKVTSPTSGVIKAQGRIASLLEVGTGFHPELTGRENIYMNGAILGMTKQEISRKFDEIVDFAGVERYIDTPTKRYSSGMKVRLGFAVAAFLEPEILVVDEVLAVGDAEFQKKAIGKMQEVSKGRQRTVLFVSHNMAAIKSLCSKGVVLENGQVNFVGDVDSAISKYNIHNAYTHESLKNRKDRAGSGKFRFIDVKFLDKMLNPIEAVESQEKVFIEMMYEADDDINFSQLIISIAFADSYGNFYAFFVSDEMGIIFKRNAENVIRLHIPSLALRAGNYQLRLFAAYQTTANVCDAIEGAAVLEIQALDFWKSGKLIRNGYGALMHAEYLF